ncbi:ester cyclase [Flavihumibacter solisilvae]|uniref:ester cyclase n=1 Tax=Flavihumibacter solisilvae TaxID=1349421 RepID=UPI000691C387|nr:ester cyclase [Flavihumibacter solisilvae]
MDNIQKNKELVIEYFNAISGFRKTREILVKFLADQHLIEHIEFFDSVFPAYEIFADEITAEGNRVVVRARVKGRHEGELNGIPPTHKSVDFPFAIGYEIENNKIINHWLIADQMALMEQLGVMNAVAES